MLLSTYNGEKYIKEQLESILNQKRVEVTCLIRDDGSTDGTREIIREFCSKYANFHYFFEENVGVVESFNILIQNSIVDKYRWVAFCDQDDVWLENKLYNAVTYLKDNFKQGKPMLYCSNLNVVDSDLNFIRKMRRKTPKYTKKTALVQNIATGCTCVYNQVAVEMYRKAVGVRMEFHDYWMFLICLYMGSVVYDDNAYILYRQHGNNVVGSRNKSLRKAVNNLLAHNGERRVDMLNDFLNLYKDELSDCDIVAIRMVVDYRCSLIARLRLVLSPNYRGYSIETTLGFKIRGLLGKIY